MLNISCPVNDSLGYGIASVNIIKILYEEGVEFALFPRGGQKSIQIQDQSFSESVKYGLNNQLKSRGGSPCLNIWHQHSLFDRIGNGKYYAMTFFELDKFTEQELASLRFPDQLIVASDWQKEVLGKNGVMSHCSVVPLGVENYGIGPDDNVRQNDTYVFMNVGKWEVRKRQDEIVQAFNNEFSQSDDVELWLLCDNPFFDCSEIRNRYLATELGNKIKWIPRRKTHREVISLMSMSDCGIFPSSAEAWNFGPLEMMSLGKEVILSNYSGHTQYANEFNSILLNEGQIELAEDGRWFHGTGNWMKPYGIEIENRMRTAFNRKLGGRNSHGISTGKEFSWSNCVKNLMEVIDV